MNDDAISRLVHDWKPKSMRLEYRTDGRYDWVLLVNPDSGFVRSDWVVDRAVMKEFANCTQDAADWDDRGGSEHRPEEYGTLLVTREGYALIPVDMDRWNERVEFFCH